VEARNVGLRLSEASLLDAQCEALFELFTGTLGVLELGRLLKGSDAGRLVLLRKLAAAPSADLASASDLARSLAHPQLAKVLGIVHTQDAWYVASEYISGVSLFELTRTVAERGSPLDTAVAVRIVLDTLKAAKEAQQLLAVTANLHGVRSVHSESVWIARYGEVFISELLIASALADDRATPPVDDAASALEALARLLGAEASPEPTSAFDKATQVPGLSEVLLRLMGESRSEPTLDDAIAALSELAGAPIASEDDVAAELDRVVGLVLERRSQKIAMLERASLNAPADDEATRYFRVFPTPTEREKTTRPPPDPNSAPPSGAPPSDVTALVRSVVAHPSDVPTEPPPTSVETQEQDAEDDGSGNAISAVWRQARVLLDTTAQRAKLNGKARSDRAARRSHPHPDAAPVTEAAQAEASSAWRFPIQTLLLAAVAALALGLLIRIIWTAVGH